MTLPKLSVALTLLLLNTNASSASSKGRTETTQDWYAATQGRALMTRIFQRNAKIQASAASAENEDTLHGGSTERHLSYSSTNSVGKQRAFKRLSKHQPPSPQDVLNSLEAGEYDKLWIEIRPEATSSASSRTRTSRRSGSCVWSECALDDVDEEYTGDNRDGDEQWYQFRTQTFCANAAYSLYGRKKGDVLGMFGDCTGRHFINSFFTYGGSDNLLKALGKSPQVYHGGDSNADCVAGDNGYSTLGCAASGYFEMAYFGGNTCDGNYFSGSGDTMSNYNSLFKSIKCKEMKPSSDLSAVQTLLQGSWACDVRTYDDSCPDPFQRKSYYEYALQTAQNGGNPIRAYNHLLWKDELRLFSWVMLAISGLAFFAAFSIKQCAIKKKPDIPTSSEYDDQLSPTASSMQTGSFRLELDDGGRLKNIMEDVSAKTLAAAAWVQWKIGRGKKPEPERTFQTSSPQKSGDAAYKGPVVKSPIQITRSTTPSAARLGLNACLTDESALEMPPTSSVELTRTKTSPQGKVLEPRQSLQ
eukprot:scaffold8361_cov136-Skeletonema_menzelii.AAC.1